MPFTIGGDWIEGNKHTETGKPKKPVKVHKVKRKKALLTIIYNIEDKEIMSQLKKNLGCGGSIKEGNIELQGDHVNDVERFLKTTGHLR